MDDIPIDPLLLAEDAAAEDAFDDRSEAGSDQASSLVSVGEPQSGEEEEEEEDNVQAGPSTGPGDTDDEVFGRLAGLVSRAGSSGKAGPIGGREFQMEIEMADTEQLPQTQKRKPSKPRRAHKPTHEVQRLLGQANLSYSQGENDKAIELYLEIIRHDPYVMSAWTTLASIHSELGNEEPARQMRFFAAHLDNDLDTWKELAAEFRENSQGEQCVYCLRKALKLEPSDVTTLWELASLYRQQGRRYKAIDVYKKMLRAYPTFSHDFNVLMEFHQSLLDANQHNFAAKLLREAFDYHVDHFASPSDQPIDGSPNTLTLERLDDIIDVLMQIDDLDQGLEVIRRGQRWLQGRKDQRNWDTVEDDREYDPPGTQRLNAETKKFEDGEGFPLEISLRHRLALIRTKLGNDDEAAIHINEVLTLDVFQYHSLFLELGATLLKRELWEKALECYACIQECEELPDDPTHIYAIGVCHHQLKNLPQALEALQWVFDKDSENLEARLRLANVLEDMGRKTEALDLVSEVIRSRAHRDRDVRVTRKEPLDNLSKSERAVSKKLSKRVLEDQMRSQMRSLWEDVQDAERGIEEGDIGALDRFIQAAGTMIENYRMNRGNFTKSRGVVRVVKTKKSAKKNDIDSQALEMQDRLERMLGFEDDAPADAEKYTVFRRTEFYGLNYEEWLTLMIKYCCVLMVKNEEDIALDILEHVLWSGLFHNRRCDVAIRLTILACAIRMRAYDKVTEHCRRLAQMHQFRVEPLLLLLGCMGGGGLRAQAAWSTPGIQGFINRELKTYDDAATDPKTLHYSAQTGRWAPNKGTSKKEQLKKANKAGQSGAGQEEPALDDEAEGGESGREEGGEEEEERDREGDGEGGKPQLPTQRSPYFNVLHGLQMVTTRSHQSALFYLLRAYEQDQFDPFICLLIAQSFFGRAMNRQSDNRNYQMAQALAFLTRYRKLSRTDDQSLEEVEYNYGRCFHGIGVVHLAVVHYERVLTSVKKRMDATQDSEFTEEIRTSSLAYEAAHNLMLIYSASGSTELVKEKSKWLAI